tara:strand:+ start:997 stop:1626 length:630 start_codon:yes stop_codon:yes gene_type:complete
MAHKPTKRRAFNFLRSYYDVLNELPKDKDKLDFIMSILNKQFIDQDPKDLNFLVNICYQSQRHSIEQSVNGYKQKMKTDLLGNHIEGGTVGGTVGGKQAPLPQEEEEEEEKVQEKEKTNIDSNKLLSVFNSILGKKTRVVPDKANKQLKAALKAGYSKDDIVTAITNASKDPHHVDSNYKYLTLEFITRPDKLDRFINMSDFTIKSKMI